VAEQTLALGLLLDVRVHRNLPVRA
jgi:hypothetical protein